MKKRAIIPFAIADGHECEVIITNPPRLLFTTSYPPTRVPVMIQLLISLPEVHIRLSPSIEKRKKTYGKETVSLVVKVS